MVATALIPPTSIDRDDYRRAARRLRATLGHDRRQLYQSLSSLSRRRDRCVRDSVERPADRFAQLVRQSLDGTVLRYSQRLMLLRRAKYFGLDRFEANLVIAAVQHRTRETRHAVRPALSPGVHLLSFALAIQIVILAAGYLLFRN